MDLHTSWKTWKRKVIPKVGPDTQDSLLGLIKAESIHFSSKKIAMAGLSLPSNQICKADGY